MDSPQQRRRLLALLPVVSEAIRSEADEIARATLDGCTWGDAKTIGQVHFDYDDVARPSDLVGLSYTTRAGVTGSLRRLEGAGLIARRRAEGDGRVLLVCMTEKGRASLQTAISAFDGLISRRFGHLSDEEIDGVSRFGQDQQSR